MSKQFFIFCLLSVWSQSGILWSQVAVDFASEIRPLLSANCFQCHGPDSNKREAKLRLDLADDSFLAALGELGNSEILRRISSHDEDVRMPPPDSRLNPLSKRQIKLITDWISQGGTVSDHWAYRPVNRKVVPLSMIPPALQLWPINQIDRFVLKGLLDAGLSPSPRADRSTLLRRVSLDLTGLPPGFEDQNKTGFSFLDYSRHVENLLAQPSYGERMAIEWLDLVRYADSSGIHSDNPISMSPFRDYVIEAFNDDLPFDRFTREQIAGDLLPGATQMQKIASAYNRLNMMTTEGGAQDKEYLARYAADRVRTTSMTWLGSTIGCAECHDHKYDPFTSRDFYQFAAFFSDITEKGYYPGAEQTGDWGPRLDVPSRQQIRAEQAIQAAIAEVDQQIAIAKKSLVGVQAEWEKGLQSQGVWKVLDLESVSSTAGLVFKQQDDGSFLVQGSRPSTDVYSLKLKPKQSPFQAIRLEVIADDSLPRGGPGRAGGNFVLSEIRLIIREDGKSKELDFAEARATFDQVLAGEHSHYGIWHAKSAIDKDKHGAKPGWAILPQVGKSNFAVFVLKHGLKTKDDQRIEILLEQKHDNPGHLIGRFRLSVWLANDSEGSMEQWMVPDPVRNAAKRPPENRSVEETKVIERFFTGQHPRLKSLTAKREGLLAQFTRQKKQRITVLTTVAREPREIRILPRGNWLDDSGAVVTAAVPQFLDPVVERESKRMHVPNRLDLANWLVSRDNPLTARVQVNRLWKKFFGVGLVKVSDDFGSQGSLPSHPELLDWLAIELMESGWDVKHVIRLIVSSATYQQSSLPHQRQLSVDFSNRMLSRQNRFRLEAELVRDQALAVSGLMVKAVGGPSIKPYQPMGYYQHLNFPRRQYQADKGSSQYRRGVYTHWQRLFLQPALLAFDAPSREECTAERVRSNTPQQALVLLNDPSFVEAARVFAERIIGMGESTEQRIQFAVNATLGRSPSSQEREILLSIFEASRIESERTGELDFELLEVGDFRQIDSKELLAWTSVARVLFNLHEFTTRY
jgi:hypothetical protein